MAKIEVDVEFSVTPSMEGMQFLAWINEDLEPTAEYTITWKELVDREMEYHLIGDKGISPDSVEELEQLLNGVQEFAFMLEETLKNTPVFFREKWVNGDSDFKKTYTEYKNDQFLEKKIK